MNKNSLNKHNLTEGDFKNSNDIAIVGMSCRFPGDANTPEAFWDLIENKVDAIDDIPKERWDTERYYDPEKNTKGKMYTKQGGFLKDVDLFDNLFFKISPFETESLDPQVRLMLELGYEVIEDAGFDSDKLKGSVTGVFIGMTIVDYIEKDIRSPNPTAINAYSVTGTQMSSASGRISFAFGLEGPSITLDTACSSSLTTVHLACQSLLSGDSNLAIAGGVNLILSPKYHVAFCELNALANDSRSKAFDASADGFVRSEGAGLVLLKRYEDAVRDKDNILAVISGSAITNDGTSKGYTVPKMESQAKAIRAAMDMAMVGPDDIDYFEAHGTGTPVGDPIEMEGIVSAFKERKSDQKLYVGSVKTNIGHCESAAGIAGLIKSVLALQNNKIPSNLHFNTPNPNIDWANIPVQIPTSTVIWLPNKKARYASVSAFGLSGTNVNVILKEAPKRESLNNTNIKEKEQYILPLAAANNQALKILAEQYIDTLNISTENEWKAICAGAALHRSHLGCRYAAKGKSREELIKSLKECIDDDLGVSINGDDKKIVFVFPGQGSQWVGMGCELMKKEQIFKQSMQDCDAALSHFVDWSLLEEIAKDENNSRFSEVDYIQPILFAIEVSMAKLWESYGVKPDVVVGHSMGEVAAAHIAGVLSLEDAAAIICKRSSLAKTVSGEGAMLLVELSFEEAQKIIIGHEEFVAIGACNGPRSTVLSGSSSSINEIVTLLNEREIFNRLIKVDYASHSPQMDQLKPKLLEEIKNINPNKGSVPIYSTVHNKIMDGTHFNSQYWTDNLRKPVLFAQAVEQLLIENDCVFVEVSPHPILVQLIEQGIEHYNKASSYVIHTIKRDISQSNEFINSFKNLYENSVRVDWNKFYENAVVNHDQLPTYPWQKDRFWIDNAETSTFGYSSGTIHPFLGREIKFANDKNIIYWESVIDLASLPYLKDHQVKNTVIFPAAGYLELIYAAIRQSFGMGFHQICDISFKQPLLLDTIGKAVQVIINVERKNYIHFEIYSADPNEASTSSWEFHCQGNALLFKNEPELSSLKNTFPSYFDDFPVHFNKEEHYKMMENGGVYYGERFRGVQEIWANSEKAIGKIDAIDKVKEAAKSYHVHPAILDACFQVCMASLSRQEKNSNETYLPSGIETFYIKPDATFEKPLWVCIDNVNEAEIVLDVHTKNIKICDEEGNALIIIEGFSFKKLKEENDRLVSDTFYKFAWNKINSDTKQMSTNQPKTWLLFEDDQNVCKDLIVCANEQNDRVIMVRKADEYAVLSDETVLIFELNISKKDHFLKLFFELNRQDISITDTIYLWGLSKNNLNWNKAEQIYMGLIYLIQALNETEWEIFPKLTVITSASQQVITDEKVNIFSAPLFGMSRVAFHEHSEFDCTRIDLSDTPEKDSKFLSNILYSGSEEKEIAIRDNNLFAHRLNHYEIPKFIDTNNSDLKTLPADDAVSFQFVTDEPGVLDNITVRETEIKNPSDDEIEVKVQAVGLNFMNVMSALGIYPGSPKGFLCLGIEFAGIVNRIGSEVTDLKVGDRVIGLSPQHDCFGKYTICKSLQAVKIPDHMNFLDAATIAVAYGTSYACLIAHGNLKKGERVLIHSATGGVGIAAIEIAKNVGAEIYATAGTEEKRELLRKMGVKYVMDSHSLDFVKEIRNYTNGEGIDVVLNSLTGEAMIQSIKLLRGFGRFLEIGKKDVYENSILKMDIFKESISYTFFDLHKMLNERPDLVRGHLNNVMNHFENGHYAAIPKTVFPASAMLDGFNMMAKGQHVGKIVFDLNDPLLMVEPAKKMFSENDTYLITGGMGGLGFALAEWMCEKGAVNIVLVGRNKPSDARQKEINKLIARKKNILILNGDISNPSDVDLILNEIRLSMPELKGVFHAAGSLSDSSIAKLNVETFRKPIEVKIQGALNLHNATLNDNLKYFVLFSSVASTIGSIGQANYVAGNAFMDALSKERQSLKLTVNCINWGPIAEIGLAAEQDIRGGRLEEEGISSFTVNEYIEAIELVLTNQLTDVNVFNFNHAKWVENNPSYAVDKLLDNLTNSKQIIVENNFVQMLKESISFDESALMMEVELQEILGGILKAAPGKIDKDLPFVNLGLDSLMAIQFRNKLQKLIGIQISITTFWNYPKIHLLARHLLNELNIKTELFSAEEKVIINTDKEIDLLIEEMSDSEMLEELDRELNNL